MLESSTTSHALRTSYLGERKGVPLWGKVDNGASTHLLSCGLLQLIAIYMTKLIVFMGYVMSFCIIKYFSSTFYSLLLATTNLFFVFMSLFFCCCCFFVRFHIMKGIIWYLFSIRDNIFCHIFDWMWPLRMLHCVRWILLYFFKEC